MNYCQRIFCVTCIHSQHKQWRCDRITMYSYLDSQFHCWYECRLESYSHYWIDSRHFVYIYCPLYEFSWE